MIHAGPRRRTGNARKVVLQAERHTSESSYRLTLRNFGGSRSECSWGNCGDGILEPALNCGEILQK